MASRALIIAIEEYPRSTSGMMEKKLAGVIASAQNFRDWLVSKWAAAGIVDQDVIFCSEPIQPNGKGATSQDIIDALDLLEKKNQISSTDELFVYFSGHGFRFEEAPGTSSDVLVPSDFVNRGNVCLKLDEIVNWLRCHLGPGKHYYFIDACRNVLNRSQMQVGDALAWNPKVNGEATTYIMQSTVSGAPALVAGPFAKTLLGGLKGRSRAKIWAENLTDGMLVRYDSLRTYLKKTLASDQPITSRVEGEDGESDAVFTKLTPPPFASLKVELNNFDASKVATLTLTRPRTKSIQTQSINGPISLPLEPDNYLLELTAAGTNLQPKGAQAIDLYEEEQILVFESVASGLESMEPPPEPSESAIRLEPSESAELEIRGVDSPLLMSTKTSKTVKLPHGRYETTLRSHLGTILRQETVEISRETASDFDPLGMNRSTIHQEIARVLPAMGGSPQFSETLGGGMDDPDSNLWLTLLGGGRIIGSEGTYSKISRFQLHDFSNIPPNGTAIYVLAGASSGNPSLRVALGSGPKVNWVDATTPADLPSAREAYIEWKIGSEFVSLHQAGTEPLTLATCLLPNRVTLIVVTTNEEGEPIINQFILPLGHLIPQMQPEIQSKLSGRNHLQDLKFLSQAMRAFHRRKKLRAEFSGTELDELLHAKWVDPVGAALAAYEYARRGDLSYLGEVSHNLCRYFPEFPDGPAIAKLAGLPATPVGVPLFLDGWLALRKLSDSPPSPQGSLNHGTAQTSWHGAVAK